VISRPDGKGMRKPRQMRTRRRPAVSTLTIIQITSPCKIHIAPMVIWVLPLLIESRVIHMSKVKKQFIDCPNVKNCHPRGIIPKFVTKTLQKNTKTKKRTPPAPPPMFHLTSCPTSNMPTPWAEAFSLPVFSFIAPAAQNPGQTSPAYILKNGETNPIRRPSLFRLILCYSL